MADIAPEVKSEEKLSALANNGAQDEIKKEFDASMEQDSNSKDLSTANEIKHDTSVKTEITSSNTQVQKKIRKRARTRGKRRSKRQKLTVQYPSVQNSINDIVSKLSSSETEDEYCLNVSNLPNNWSYIEIKNYIDTECGPVDEIEFVQGKNKNVSGSIRLCFHTKNECRKAKEKLDNNVVNGKKLCVTVEGSPVDSDSEMLSNTEILTSNVPSGQDMDLWEDDPASVYGLKPEFLQSLDITPPLSKWVCVSNFRCDKTELRDILELAGHVLMCAVFTIKGKSARVLYSHPLEAVQAVSMLNGQLFYGKKLKVVMEKCPNDMTLLPKGLTNVGLGLGIKGQPLRNVVKHYKRHLQHKSSFINPILFTSKCNNGSNTSEYINREKDLSEKVKDIKSHIDSQIQSLKFKNVEDASSFTVVVDKDDSDSDFSESCDKKSNEIKTITTVTRKVAPPNISPSNKGLAQQQSPFKHLVPTTAAVINPNFINGLTSMNAPNTQPGPPGIAEYRPPRPIVRPALGPNPGPVPRPGLGMGLRPMPGSVAGPIRGLVPGPFGPGPRPPMANPMAPGSFSGPRPFGPQPMPKPNSITVRLSNLPLNTTFPYLCEKLSQCGQVVSLQLTEPGCAVVTFGNRAQADRCFQTYNRVPAEGNIIEVHYI